MSLIIRNLQRAVPIRRALLRKRADQIRHILGVQQFDLAIICISNPHIQRLNRTYRSKDIPTDVLSFPFHENLKPGELAKAHCQDLGDIFLGVEYIYQQCEENKEDFNSILTCLTKGTIPETELQLALCHCIIYRPEKKKKDSANKTFIDCHILTYDLASSSCFHVTVAHGLCHLLGYRHSTEEEWRQMYERETQILQELNRLSGMNLQPLTKNHF